MLQAGVRHSSDNEVPQILVDEICGLIERRENVQSCERGRVGHRGQVDQRLDRSTPKLLPDPLVFLRYLVICRVLRPVDACTPEVFEASLDGTAALIQRSVEFRLQACDGGTVSQIPSATLQHRQPLFCCREIAGQELALSQLQLQRKGERVPLLPTLLW